MHFLKKKFFGVSYLVGDEEIERKVRLKKKKKAGICFAFVFVFKVRTGNNRGYRLVLGIC